MLRPVCWSAQNGIAYVQQRPTVMVQASTSVDGKEIYSRLHNNITSFRGSALRGVIFGLFHLYLVFFFFSFFPVYIQSMLVNTFIWYVHIWHGSACFLFGSSVCCAARLKIECSFCEWQRQQKEPSGFECFPSFFFFFFFAFWQMKWTLFSGVWTLRLTGYFYFTSNGGLDVCTTFFIIHTLLFLLERN